MTQHPAEILRIDAGTLNSGALADVTLFDPEASWRPTSNALLSAGKNSPFLHWELQGRVTHTLHNGQIVYEAP